MHPSQGVCAPGSHGGTMMTRMMIGLTGIAATILFVAVLDAGSEAVTVTRPEADSVAVAVFEGRTPCATIATEFTGFPSQNCEKIKWELTLFRDSQTQRPSAFLYRGTRSSRRGTWTIHRGTVFDANAQVYRLTPTPPGRVLSLLSVDDKVLVLLDADGRVVVGDASWSYVLNRTDRNLMR